LEYREVVGGDFKRRGTDKNQKDIEEKNGTMRKIDPLEGGVFMSKGRALRGIRMKKSLSGGRLRETAGAC